MEYFFNLPFADTGDKVDIPNEPPVSGEVSYEKGYGTDYSTDPTAAGRRLERDKQNGLFNNMTQSIRELQVSGVPDFITSDLVDPVGPFSYGLNAQVRIPATSLIYQSLVANNVTTPPSASWLDITDWVANIPTGDASTEGKLKLSSSVASTLNTNNGTAATPLAVKTAYDKGVEGLASGDAAQSTANTANSAANTALTNAATADGKAVSAQNSANAAQGTANTALTNAATADGKAVADQSTANTANSTANTALANAAAAQATADGKSTKATFSNATNGYYWDQDNGYLAQWGSANVQNNSVSPWFTITYPITYTTARNVRISSQGMGLIANPRAILNTAANFRATHTGGAGTFLQCFWEAKGHKSV